MSEHSLLSIDSSIELHCDSVCKRRIKNCEKVPIFFLNASIVVASA